jgi:hypothetical protein
LLGVEHTGCCENWECGLLVRAMRLLGTDNSERMQLVRALCLLGVAIPGSAMRALRLLRVLALLALIGHCAASACLAFYAGYRGLWVVGYQPGVLKVFRGQGLCSVKDILFKLSRGASNLRASILREVRG